MTCGNCGREVPSGNKFCTNCGWRVPEDFKEEVKTEEVPEASEEVKAEEAPVTEGAAKAEEAPAVEEVKAEEAPAVEEVKAEEVPAVEEVKAEEVPAVEEVKTEEAPVAAEETAKVEEAPVVEAAPAAEAVKSASAPKAEAPAAPAKKKGSKAPLFVGIAAVVVVLLVVFNLSSIKNTAKRTFSSPENYYHWVEKNTAKEAAGTVSSIYANYFLDALKVYNMGTSAEVSVELDEAGQDMLSLAGAAGVDLSWFKSASLTYEGYSKDNVMEMKCGLAMEKKNVISADLIIDMAEEAVYLAVPELSKTYIGVDVSEIPDISYYMDTLDNSTEYMDALKAILAKLPEEKQVKDLTAKYLEIALDSIDDVNMKKGKTLKAEGVSESCTLLEVTLDADTLQNVIENVAEQLENDREVKAIIEKLCDEIAGLDLDELDGIDIDSEEVYEYFQDACSELADEAQYISFDEELVMSLYVDGKGVIRGRSFEFNDGWSNYTVEILNPHKGGKIGFKAAVTVDNQEFSIAGSGKESGGKVSGDFSAKYNGTAIVDLTAKNFDTDALKKGYLNGTFTVKAASGISKVLGMSSVPSMVTDLAVTVDVSMDGKSGKLAVSVAEDKDKWGTVSVSAKKESGRKASVPADKNTVFIEDYSDVEDYWDTVDLDSLINTLDKLDVPSFVTDILEDFADLDGDELLENAEYIIYNNLYSG